jgi:hypothetical protein
VAAPVAAWGRREHSALLDSLELADSPVAHQLCHPVIDRQRTVFGARLEHSTVPADFFDQNPALIDGQRGLFALHVLACARRHHAHQRVPVIRRGNHHRIDIFPGEDLTEILGSDAILVIVGRVDDGLGLAESVFIHVANHQHPGFSEFQVAA